jgi:adenosylhomocysteinase
MSIHEYFSSPKHLTEKKMLPILNLLIDKYKKTQPFAGKKIALGHLLVRNTVVLLEALIAGGAEVIIAEGFPSETASEVIEELREHGFVVYKNEEAVYHADIYLDVNALLGKIVPPMAAVELTRTGIFHYQSIGCPVVSADDCKSKKIEGFFGTSDGFVRAWQKYFPTDPLRDKKIVQFGYGKIGKGVAFGCRQEGANITIIDIDANGLEKAAREGFKTVIGNPNGELENILREADIVLAVTGVPKFISKTLPADWFRANKAKLINLGAEDEFGHLFEEKEILMGKAIPFNFHLANPTQNRYIDPAFAAHLLGLEALLSNNYSNGIHSLPEKIDNWIVKTWRDFWPNENLSGIAEELGII